MVTGLGNQVTDDEKKKKEPEKKAMALLKRHISSLQAQSSNWNKLILFAQHCDFPLNGITVQNRLPYPQKFVSFQ